MLHLGRLGRETAQGQSRLRLLVHEQTSNNILKVKVGACAAMLERKHAVLKVAGGEISDASSRK